MPRPAHPIPTPPAGVPAAAARTVGGRWLLLDQIGAGGTATVWRALDLENGTEVAAKILGRHTGALLARFWREQEIRLRHPHLVTAIGWAAEEDVVLLVTDLVRGGSVLDLLDDHGPLPDGVVASVVAQTLSALVTVHASDLVHRDVTPGNLLLDLTPDGSVHVRLADFGVAVDTTAPRLTVEGGVGTLGYLAPDLDHTPDPRHDLYALGAVALHLLTGRPYSPGDRLPASRLTPLLRLLVAPDRHDRPATAVHALALLDHVDLPEEPGTWVRDRLGPCPRLSHRGRLPARAAPAPWAAAAVRAGAGVAWWTALLFCTAVIVWSTAGVLRVVTGVDLGFPFLDWVP